MFPTASWSLFFYTLTKVKAKNYIKTEMHTIFHQHGHAHESLPIPRHTQNPNSSEDLAEMSPLHHPLLLCQNYVHVT